jgi:putative oxygen-independent coproporphyrinogen III oxidase
LLNKQPLGVYVHWPFCVSKCPYCDFNSHIQSSIDIELWTKAYLLEIQHSFEKTSKHEIKTIFFGGGTPSLMPPQLMDKIINKVCSLWSVEKDIEITFEANPSSVESSKFQDFRKAGANRVSLGVQSFDDDALVFLKRPHSAGEAVQAIELANSLFGRVSFDLMYARPNQTLKTWRKELETALLFRPSHISLYQLTIEPGTAFYTAFHRGDFKLPEETLSAELYETTNRILSNCGLEAYEVSNYAIPGQECRHNLMYWTYQDYVGVGPGAHGRLTQNGRKIATRRHNAPSVWLDSVLANGHGEHELEVVTAPDIEFLLMGLRLTQGVSKKEYELISGVPLPNPLKFKVLQEEGEVWETESHFGVTTKGRLRLNAILNFLIV